MTPLNEQILRDIQQFALSARPLYNHIRVKYDIIDAKGMKGMLAVKAPHYIAISSETGEGYLTNAGFLLQQVDLYLQSIGLGSCWLGMAKPAEVINNSLKFVILLAFGNPLEEPYRSLSEFKRKPLSAISDISDRRLEAVRLAPSGINSQPWYFMSDRNIIHVYCVKHGKMAGLIYERLNKIDMGIALTHLYVSNDGRFRFYIEHHPGQPKGYYYIGSVEI